MNVYLIPHASEPRFKIGKANDLQARIAHLDKANPLDLSKCYALECESEERAFAIEKGFHLLFADARLEGDPDAWGDGFSEWFDMEAFLRALAVAGSLSSHQAKSSMVIGSSISGDPESQKGTASKRGERPSNRRHSTELRFVEFLSTLGFLAADIEFLGDLPAFIKRNGEDWEMRSVDEMEFVALDWLKEESPSEFSHRRAKSLTLTAGRSLPGLSDSDKEDLHENWRKKQRRSRLSLRGEIPDERPCECPQK